MKREKKVKMWKREKEKKRKRDCEYLRFPSKFVGITRLVSGDDWVNMPSLMESILTGASFVAMRSNVFETGMLLRLFNVLCLTALNTLAGEKPNELVVANDTRRIVANNIFAIDYQLSVYKYIYTRLLSTNDIYSLFPRMNIY